MSIIASSADPIPSELLDFDDLDLRQAFQNILTTPSCDYEKDEILRPVKRARESVLNSEHLRAKAHEEPYSKMHLLLGNATDHTASLVSSIKYGSQAF